MKSRSLDIAQWVGSHQSAVLDVLLDENAGPNGYTMPSNRCL